MYVLVPTFTAPIAYVLFLIFMKIALRNDQSGQNPDWPTWIARAVSVMLVCLVAVSIMLLDKSMEKTWEVYEWPADNFFRIVGIFMVIPINWIVLNPGLR